ncbi:MAG: CheA signal transduction histidine kinase, partial [Pelosinus sp.]|nr:CheA signal transduction histidine kinase [Pelosinus sp.]
MDTNQYMGMFLEESREHLQTLNSCLLELEHNPENPSVLNEIFRSAHTIKGMSATMGFTEIAELTHEMENVLDLLRKNQLKANEDIVDTIFKCVDTLEQMVESIASETEHGIDVSTLVKKLVAIAKGEATPAPTAKTEVKEAIKDGSVQQKDLVDLNDTELAVLNKARTSGLQPFEIKITLSETCLLKSARAYIIMNALDEIGEVIKTVPPSEDLEQENFDKSFEIIFITSNEKAKVQETLLSVSEVASVDINMIDIEAAEEVIDQKQEVPTAAPIASKPGEKATPAKPPAQAPGMDKKLKSGQSVRVDIEKLDSLLNLVGELVINKTRLEQIGITHRLTELVETIEQMDRVTTDLQSVVMKVRMVPVGQVFNRFPRMVRDLSRELNKEINLTIEGEETELDRTVIDEIGDPLVHLIRNSLDHGVEHPDERVAKGKDAIGEVRLIARHEGNNV